MSALDEKLKKLAGEKPGGNQTIKKPTHKSKGVAGTPADGRKNNGGKGDIGRKPSEQKILERGWKAKLDDFHNGEMTVQITDPKTGAVRTVPKNRVLIAMETLFTVGVTQKDVDALNKYLDRALGKPKQPVTGGDEGDEPIKHEIVGLETILDKAYGDDD